MSDWDKDPEKRQRYLRLVGALGGIPTLLAAGGVVGYFIGRWIDDRLGTAPWMQLLFFFLGMASGIQTTRRLLKQVGRDIDKM
jgi:ATP synthase protein I